MLFMSYYILIKLSSAIRKLVVVPFNPYVMMVILISFPKWRIGFTILWCLNVVIDAHLPSKIHHCHVLTSTFILFVYLCFATTGLQENLIDDLVSGNFLLIDTMLLICKQMIRCANILYLWQINKTVHIWNWADIDQAISMEVRLHKITLTVYEKMHC